MKFVLIPPGEFDMGSTAEEVARLLEEANADEKAKQFMGWYTAKVRGEAPRHRVRITTPFYLAVAEVTQAEYERVTGNSPSQFKGDPSRPVEMVAWDEVTAFCAKLGELAKERAAGAVYRLPTEAEWEYACRAGTTTKWYCGNDNTALRENAWYLDNAAGTTHPVRQKVPNAWGLYDMHGNVWEWCQDWYGAYGVSPANDPTGPSKGSGRVIRGGPWDRPASGCRAACRWDWSGRHGCLGFRVARAVPSAKTVSAPSAGEAVSETLPKDLSLDLGSGVKMDFVLVPAGSFMMGGPGKSQWEGQGNEGPIHKVTITKPFCIGKYELTVAQFAAFVQATGYQTDCEKAGNRGSGVKDGRWGQQTGVNWRKPGIDQTADHPVVLVSWNDAQAFVAWLSKQSGRNVRLPTEAQWEYAARGPKNLEYPFGQKWDGLRANHCDVSLKNTGWKHGGCSNDNDGYAHTAPVGSFGNASWCGALDMAGNAWEWVQDWEADYSADAQVDPQGPASGQRRVTRGGSWVDNPQTCRGASRERMPPDGRTVTNGFRVLLESR
jgi:formylglycine-generating enzyme required for sulfatase activity